MPKLNVQQNNQNVIQAFRNALAIGRLKGIIASDGNHNFSTSGTNPNLLDNAYFVGGGSQLGNGIFPINQKGQTSYTGAVTGFDRWKVDGGFTATLESGGVRTTSTTQYVGLSQIMPAYKLENGETYTYSIVVDGVLHAATFVANNDGNWVNIYYGADWYVPYRFVNGAWEFKVINSISSEMNHLVSKAKIEKGTVSTLLNDVPPDFGEELRKCQYYYRELSVTSSIALAAWAYSNTACTVYNIFGVGNEMRTNSPTIAASGTWQVQTQAGTLINVTSFNKADGGNVFGVNFVASGLTANQPCRIIGSTGAKITFSAEP